MAIQYRKAKTKVGIMEGKPTVYKAQQITYPMVSFSELIEECSEACGVGKSQSKAVIEALVSRLTMYMKMGHGVKMGEFGSFKPVFRCKVGLTAEEVTAETIVQKKIRFFPGKAFRDMLGSLGVISASEILDEEE